MTLQDARILVVGAGLMGAGIAQVAAQAGHAVALFDTRDGAAEAAKAKLASTLEGLVAKGKLTAEAAAATLTRITPVAALQPADLVIEAIVEQLDVKRALFAQLEALLADDAVIATNTSSISVTALARGMKRPERLVGMHFFNPVPLMKLVEVVSGLQTSAAVAQAIFDVSKAWGKVPVHARSTPGFIVNRIARPYYAETLALLQEQAASPALLDACLRAAGFRMGPCELMDLIGHDTNFSVTQSVYEANFFDKRFVPSLVQRELVDGGLLGRKSGQGFFSYAEGVAKPGVPAYIPAVFPTCRTLVVMGSGALADRLAHSLHQAGRTYTRNTGADWVGLSVDGAHLRQTRGAVQHDAVAQFWLPSANALFRMGIDAALDASCNRWTGWVVAESTIIANSLHPACPGQRTAGWAQMAFLTVPQDMSHGEWLERWAAEASFEHASIASFARASLELLALGAPHLGQQVGRHQPPGEQGLPQAMDVGDGGVDPAVATAHDLRPGQATCGPRLRRRDSLPRWWMRPCCRPRPAPRGPRPTCFPSACTTWTSAACCSPLRAMRA